MEDQQPDPGDLTETPSEAMELGDEPEVLGKEPADKSGDAAPVTEQSNTGNWLVRRKSALAVGISVALFVGASGFAAAAAQPYFVDRSIVATKLDIAKTAADAITTLWTYTPDDMDQLPNRSARYLSGDFLDQYRKFVDAIAPTNKQAQVTNATQVVGAAVESLRGSESTAIVYTNTTSKSPQSKDIPSIKYLSYRLELKRQSGRWLVTKMTTVTSLDLTPKL